MKKLTLSMLLSFAIVAFTFGQDQSGDFKAEGKPFIKVFTNYHSTLGDDGENAFEIQRAYFGYGVKFNENFSGNVTIDVGSPGGESPKLDMTAYLKNAYFQYKKDAFAIKFGMIGLSQFSLQEKQWGGRYLYKSFQDQHGFGSSADLGVHASYKIHKMLSVDASILNGEGYKKIESDGELKYTAGLTLKPVKGLALRAYYDMMGSDNPQQTMSFYAGYTMNKFKLGAEYNQQMNYKVTEGQDKTGMSFYASYELKKLRLFGRFDQVGSVTIDGDNDPWNMANDGQAFLAGVEFNPVKGIKITPNYQLWMPDTNNSEAISSVYLSCQIAF